MPTETVIKNTCARCARVWYDAPSAKHEDPPAPSLTLRFQTAYQEVPVEVDFDLLCEGCDKAVTNYISSIRKEPKPKSEESKAKEKDADAAPSSDHPIEVGPAHSRLQSA